MHRFFHFLEETRIIRKNFRRVSDGVYPLFSSLKIASGLTPKAILQREKNVFDYIAVKITGTHTHVPFSWACYRPTHILETTGASLPGLRRNRRWARGVFLPGNPCRVENHPPCPCGPVHPPHPTLPAISLQNPRGLGCERRPVPLRPPPPPPPNQSGAHQLLNIFRLIVHHK